VVNAVGDLLDRCVRIAMVPGGMIFGMGRGRTRLPSARRRRSHSSTLFIDGELFGWGLGEWLEAQGRAEEEKEGGVEVKFEPVGFVLSELM